MLDFTEVCHFPALCKKCGKIVDVNMFDNPPQCSRCGNQDVIPYDENAMIGKAGENIVADWFVGKLRRTFALTDGQYFCPACGKYTLSFELTALFD